MRVALDEFQREYVAPARARCDVLQDEISEREAELRDLIGALSYDDEAAAALQIQLEQLHRDQGRWQRRRAVLGGRATAQSGGWVEV